MQNRANVYGGLKAQRSGSQFEKRIEISCNYYRKHKIANIDKTPEPHQVVGVMGKYFKTFIEKKAQPDFAGTLNGGKSIMFEAKHTNKASIRFDQLTDIQQQYLNEHCKLGAICLVVISFNLKDFYSVPWNEWLLLEIATGKKSVNQDDLAKYKVGSNGLRIDFLNIHKKIADMTTSKEFLDIHKKIGGKLNGLSSNEITKTNH